MLQHDKALEFYFSNTEALESDQYITSQGIDDIYLKIYRIMRLTPLPGMKQPILNRAIMGMETIIELTGMGKPLPRCKWRLQKIGKNGKWRTFQYGKTNHEGISGNIDIGLEGNEKYRLVVFRRLISDKHQIY